MYMYMYVLFFIAVQYKRGILAVTPNENDGWPEIGDEW